MEEEWRKIICMLYFHRHWNFIRLRNRRIWCATNLQELLSIIKDVYRIQIPTEVLSHPVAGQVISNNLSYDHSILFKIVSFESLKTVDYNQMICFEFIVIQTFLDSKNARDVRFCQDKSLVVCKMKGTRDRQTLV